MTVLANGALFAGYSIEGVAGRGGMGEVYKARQLTPERLVALKVIAPQLAKQDEFRERFRREANAAAQIEHPNVIPIYEVGEAENLLFIAMRYVHGNDLRALIAPDMDIERVVDLVAQVASALDAAHSKGLVHRDVKPSNVLVADLDGRDHAYLTDFGVTKLATESELTRPGNLIGSADYIAPEQIRGEQLDPRADVYSLACVLFAALTCRVPFQTDGEFSTIRAHLDDPPPSVRDLRPDVPAALEQVVLRGMAKDPDERFESTGALARAAVAAVPDAAGPADAASEPGAAEEPAGDTRVRMGSPASGSARLQPLIERTEEVVAAVASAAEERDRGDLAQRVREEVGRVGAAETTLVVAGEMGQGKSSLVNSLLGRADLSPVNAAVTTTARIVFRWAPREFARIYREGRESVDEVAVAEVAPLMTRPPARYDDPIQVIEIGLDHPLLAGGLTLVDTPGVGGLESSHAKITLSALAAADAVLFVTDASAPLNRSELTFVEQATQRIGTVIFALTKRDLYSGWEALLGADRELLAREVPAHGDAAFLPVSSRAELAAAAERDAGDTAFADALATEGGFAELRAALNREVLLEADVLRARNALQLARSALAELRVADEAALSAGGDAAELKQALRDATQRAQHFAHSKRVGTVLLGDEFTLLGQELNRELNRALAELRSGYEQVVRSNKLKPDEVAEHLEDDIRAELAQLDMLLQERLTNLVTRLARELGVGLPVGFESIDQPPEVLAPPEGAGDHVDGLARITSFMPAFFGAAAFPGIVGSLAIVLPAAAPLAPVAAIAGLSLIPLNIVQRRRTGSQQEAVRIVRDSIERARIDLPPLLTRCLLSVRRKIETDLQEALAQRERELAAAVERQRRLAEADAATRAAARNQAQGRLAQLHQLRQDADELDRDVLAAAAERADKTQLAAGDAEPLRAAKRA